ncbi:MAG: sulfotransferase family protein, partial [Candidatus Binataceae bacterium]
MSMKVIGAGFGRTGTLSLKNALEKLGLGPCYHMMEVMARPEHVALWHGLAFGKPMNWDVLFADFASTVDWPACTFWRELAAHYPDAKVLLSVRDPEAWWRSMNDTIYQAMTIEATERMPPVMRQQLEMARKLVATDTFGGRFEDKDHA